MSKRLGIIGGLGCSAGVHLVAQLVHHYQNMGAKSDSDFPDFVYHNLPVRGMDEFGICNQTQVFDQLQHSVGLLYDADCDVVFIACNTVHVFHERLQVLFPPVTIVNNIAETCRKVADCKKVGVLCSRNSKTLDLFGKALAHLDIECVETDDVEQERIDSIIEHVITGKLVKSDFLSMTSIMHLMVNRGAQRIILGCTELPLASDWEEPIMVDAGLCGLMKAIELIKA